MSGNLIVIPDARLHTDHVRALFTLTDGRGLVLEDRRLLGYVNLFTDEVLEKKLAGIGMDPLSKAFTPEFLVKCAKKSRKPAKVFLMDQKPVCGLGNIYSAESLFRAKIHPSKPAGSVRTPKLVSLHAAIRDVLKEAIPAAVRSYRDPGVHEGMQYRVYGREGEPCLECCRAIRRIEQAGRSTYFCPSCQR
jgi:formamidopyrimidine-DNA glycosylase